MARIALIHPQYLVTGGAEAVSLNAIEALQDEHSLTLFTNHEPQFDSLNDYYDTAVDPNRVSVRTPPIASHYVDRFGAQNGLLLYALLNRYVRRYLDAFDLVVGTYNELACEIPSVLYLHHPLYDVSNQHLDPRSNQGARYYYKRLSRSIAGVSNATMNHPSTTLLTNSDWMAENIKDVYGTRPRTVYPPIETSAFAPPPIEEQSRGFVSAGRVSKDKQLLRSIEILQRVRNRGHDITLHIAGPLPNTEYADRVRVAASRHAFVTIEGRLSRDELVSVIERNRYAIHGKDYEHFGIVVGEFIAGGALPFVPNTGGQCEILDQNDALLYESTDDAVETIDHVLSSPEFELSLREELPSVDEEYGQSRFRREICDVVSTAL
ncbi:glycosyltransferase family 4 protein [Halocatena marina]|uniref:glycosyltransferase family 4 protein n=1 Tax=Halocatena marina TaxID=2934937 RepID=UPI0020105909|nr:glycosyltransferase family 4 protein [Halocatena marina]